MKYSLFLPFLLIVLCAVLFSCKQKTDVAIQEVITEQSVSTIDTAAYVKFGVESSSLSNMNKLKTGMKAPNFEGLDQNGKKVSLEKINTESQVVLIFYRGYWCGYCNKHLASFIDKLDTLAQMNTRLVAISPESPDNIDKTIENSGLDITYISDKDNKIMTDYGVAFTVTDAYNEKFFGWKGVSIAEVNNQDVGVLPIPASYVIDKNGIIKWAHYTPDYSERSSADEIINQL